MDIDQLKLVLEAIQGLGSETKSVLIWYLVLTATPKILWCFGGVSLLWGVIRTIRYGLQKALTLDEIRKATDTRGEFTGEEWGIVLKCLREHYKR